MRKRLLLTSTALALFAACDDSLVAILVGGTWKGTLVLDGPDWNLSVALVQHGDSLSGTADVVSEVYNNNFFVTGKVRGDSVFMRLRPVEDADVNIAGLMFNDVINGKSWFNTNTNSTNRVVLLRSK